MNLYKSTNLKRATNCRFSTAGRPASPLATTEAPAAASPTADGGLPAPVKAAPGPNGEEYYYYYYYYDDEEGEKNVSAHLTLNFTFTKSKCDQKYRPLTSILQGLDSAPGS